MNKKLFLLLTILIIIAFGLGTLIGYYELFPNPIVKSIFKQPINQNINVDSFSKYNASSFIHENNFDDYLELRSNLINYIWKDSSLSYSKLPKNIEINIVDEKYSDLENLRQIDKFLILMEYDVTSTAYLFLPHDSNKKLMIYHQGHEGDFYHGKNTIEFFLKNGYSVLAFSMPLLGPNNQPLIETEFGSIKLASHNYFSFLESSKFSPLKFYFEPIVQSLNYVEQNFNYENVYMVGISGGGWTTTVYASLDERILQSYSIAGSIPIPLRTSENDLGDYEQTLPSFYRIANYLELYLLASIGDERKHVQIFNKYDPCCFAGDIRGVFDTEIQTILKELGGQGYYQIYVDDTHSEHKISEYSLKIIQNEINKIQLNND